MVYIVINNLISIVIHTTYYIILLFNIKTTCFDLSFGHLQVVLPTLEYSQLWGIKAYNYIIPSACVHQLSENSS
jgi:hypothetical protein